jgi:hypothetical protein
VDADIGSCLKPPEFQFKKKRMMFLHLLNSKDSQDAGLAGDEGLSADLTRSVADAVLGQQDERSTLAALETFGKDDKGIISRVQGFLGLQVEKKGCGKAPANVHRRSLTLSSFRSSRLFPSIIIYMRLPLTSRKLPMLYSQSRSTPWCLESVGRSF